jgi:hypothetical protein
MGVPGGLGGGRLVRLPDRVYVAVLAREGLKPGGAAQGITAGSRAARQAAHGVSGVPVAAR